MKRKRRVEQPDRRRPLVEMNLLAESKARSAVGSRGCASLLSRLFAGGLICMLLWQGLS